MEGFESATSSFRNAVTPDTCNLQDTNSADLNSARYAQFQGKEKNADSWTEYFPSEKKNSTKQE